MVSFGLAEELVRVMEVHAPSVVEPHGANFLPLENLTGRRPAMPPRLIRSAPTRAAAWGGGEGRGSECETAAWTMHEAPGASS
eukprot:6747998-Pyramimonas_sp.AAC.1